MECSGSQERRDLNMACAGTPWRSKDFLDTVLFHVTFKMRSKPLQKKSPRIVHVLTYKPSAASGQLQHPLPTPVDTANNLPPSPGNKALLPKPPSCFPFVSQSMAAVPLLAQEQRQKLNQVPISAACKL